MKRQITGSVCESLNSSTINKRAQTETRRAAAASAASRVKWRPQSKARRMGLYTIGNHKLQNKSNSGIKVQDKLAPLHGWEPGCRSIAKAE